MPKFKISAERGEDREIVGQQIHAEDVSGKAPPYAKRAARKEDVTGLRIKSVKTGKTLVYLPGMSAITGQQVADLKAGKLYLNIHSTAFGGGEIRGQVIRPNEQLFRATLNGASEVPAVTTTATGASNYSLVILPARKTRLKGLSVWNGDLILMNMQREFKCLNFGGFFRGR